MTHSMPVWQFGIANKMTVQLLLVHICRYKEGNTYTMKGLTLCVQLNVITRVNK